MKFVLVAVNLLLALWLLASVGSRFSGGSSGTEAFSVKKSDPGKKAAATAGAAAKKTQAESVDSLLATIIDNNIFNPDRCPNAVFGRGRSSRVELTLVGTFEIGTWKGAIILQKTSTTNRNMLRSMAGEARIVRLVNDIFTRAIELGASDIHIEPGEESVAVRCRVDGVLTEIISAPLSQFPAIASRIKLLGGLNIAESRLPQDGRTNIQLGRQELDMSPTHLEQFRKLIRIPHGIILVVGPTGSGKTTTLYSVINHLNDNKKKIITVEDPVEYKMAGLCQMQVNAKIGVTFATGLRSIVRQDPDIILVGEIRDRETADIAINAALTGHLVLSTLHTNDAVGAVTRLLDMGVENFLVSSALFGVLSQRLVRKICPVCHGKTTDAAGNKCRKCNGSGYKGRCGIFELLTVSEELRTAINRSASSSELEAIAVKEGMVTLQDDGMAKVKAGVTTFEELNRSTAEL